jgi:hypothetical protein
MRHYQVERHINAKPEEVWAILTNREAVLAANLGITRFEGDVCLGSNIKLWTEATPERAFKLTVTVFDAPHRMVWSGGMPLGLFTGTRTYLLTARDEGTDFSMREEFSGLMMPLIWKSMPDLQPSFEKFADGLATIAEMQK